MILYHGSNVVVKQPLLLESKRMLDFGPGFYTTSDYLQAQKWAEITVRRRHCGYGVVSVYEFNDDEWEKLKVKRFETASLEWLDFVTAHRQGSAQNCEEDIIIGPVANDNTMPVLRLYFIKVYTAEEALKRLMPQQLKDQYVFRTVKALSAMQFVECKKL